MKINQLKLKMIKPEVRLPEFMVALIALFFVLPLFVFAAESTFTTSLTTTGFSTLPPEIPTGLTSVAVSDTQIDLSWNPAEVNFYAIAGYRIFRDSTFLATTTSTSYSDTGLIPETAYSYTVEAFDTIFQMSGQSATSTATTTATPIVTPIPSAPSGGSISGYSGFQISNVEIIPGIKDAVVSFTTNVSAQTKVQWGLSNDFEIGSLQNVFYGYEHSQTINGLSGGLNYFVKITATNSQGITVTKEVSFKTDLPVVEFGPLPNPSDFSAEATEKNVELTWNNPKDERFNNVRIVRSEGFFPIDQFDGVPVYEGDEQSFTDKSAKVGVTYYYAIFARDTDGEYSSGALAKARIVPLGEIVIEATSTDPFINIPESSRVDPMIGELEMSDFEFIQEGKNLSTISNTVAINGGENLTIRLAYDKVPEILKTVAFTLQDPTDKTKVFPFLLRINSDKTYYEATIGALGKSGRYTMSVVILDYENKGLKRLNGTLAAMVFVAPAINLNENFDILGMLILLALIIMFGIIMMKIRKWIHYSPDLSPKQRPAFNQNKNSPVNNIYKISVILLFVISQILFGILPQKVLAAANPEINYQGKLVNTSNAAVPDGSYSIRFKLYSSLTGGSPVWTETWCNTSDCAGGGTGPDNRIAVKNGLFSVMLGSTTPFTGVDFNQPLYLSIEVGDADFFAVWDGEMEPRKILGSVPSAFVANTLSGLNSDQFLRSDIQNATSSSSTFLNILQSGAGKIAEFIGTASKSVLSILSSGNVGIGTTSPSAKLSIDQTAGGSDALFSIASSTNGTGTSTALYVANNGYVGIGKSNPGSQLDVNGSVMISSGSKYTFGNNFTGIRGSANSFVSIQTNGADRVLANYGGSIDFQNESANKLMTILSSGNVGIGTTSPFAKLSVAGVVVADSFNATNTAATSTFAGGLIAGGANGLRVFQNGNATIGTTSPFSLMYPQPKLIVYNSGANSSVEISGDPGYWKAISLGRWTIGSDYGAESDNLLAGSDFRIMRKANNGYAIGDTQMLITRNTGDISFNDNALVVNNNKNSVAIGTTTPSAKLTIWGANGGSLPLLNLISYASTTLASFFNNGSAYISGNLGLGTTSPFAKLSVAGNSYFGGNITATGSLSLAGSLIDSLNSAGTNGMVLQTTGSATQWVATSTLGFASASQIGSGTQGQVPFYNSNGSTLTATSSLFIAQSGNVGIGTTTPNTKLSVVGNISALADTSFNPTVVGTVTTGSSPRSVSISGRYAYVVNESSNSLQIIDISNSSSPTVVGTVTVGSFPSSISISGRYAYVTNNGSNSLQVIDISNPSSPTVVGTVTTGSGPESIFISGHYAYVVNSGSNSLQVIDVSGPSSPTVVGTVTTGSYPKNVSISGRYAYVVNNTSNSLQVVDISNSSSPRVVGTVTTGTNPQFVSISGRYAYVTNNGSNSLQVIDISNPSSPTVVGTFVTDGYPNSVSISGRYAYVVNGVSNSLQIVDVSNPSSPTIAGTVAIDMWPQSVSISGRYAYVANSTSNSLQVIDIGGIETTSALVHSLEAGSLQVQKDIYTAGQLSVGSGLNVGAGGIFSSGPISVSVASSTQSNPISAYFQGRVGIGTTSPYAMLSVAGETVAQKFTATSTTATSTFSGGFIAGGTSGFSVLQNGKVGIGTTSPFAKLSVAGRIVADYITATSTTATSSFAYDVSINGGLKLANSDRSIVIGTAAGVPKGLYSIDIQSYESFPSGPSYIGNYITSIGYDNYPFGSNTSSSTLVGMKNEVESANFSSIFGVNNYNYSGDYTSIFGTENQAEGSDFSLIAGYNNYLFQASSSVLVGSRSDLQQSDRSSVFGQRNSVFESDDSILLGHYNWMYNGNSTSTLVGILNFFDDSASSTVAFGNYNYAAGYVSSSTIIGLSNTVGKYTDRSTVVGYTNTIGTGATSSMIFGSNIINNIAGSMMIGPSDASKLTILSSGNVGIGTISPLAKLSIDQTVGGSDPLFSIASSTNGTGTSTALYVASNGNVGIGKNNPGYALDVSGSIVGSSWVIGTNFRTGQGNLTYTALSGASGDPDTGINFPTANGTISLVSNGSEAVRLDNNGNLGIGTTSPFVKLSVAGGSYIGGNLTATGTLTVNSYIESSDTWGIKWKFAGNSDTMEMNQTNTAWQSNINNTGGGVTRFRWNTTKTTNGFTGPMVDFNIDGSNIFYGKVGIGTSSPFAKLSVAGDSYFGGNITATGSLSLAAALIDSLNSAGTNGMVLQTTGSATQWVATSTLGFASASQIGSGTQGQVPFYDSNGSTLTATSSLFIAQSGNVGIGTTSPFAKLSISGADNSNVNQPTTFAVYGAHGTGMNGSGGDIKLVGGSTDDYGIGGSISLIAGNSMSDSAGSINITAGNSFGGGIFGAGNITLTPGVSGSYSGNVLLSPSFGKVGIGTTSPYSILSISNSASTAANIPLFTIASTTAGNSTTTLFSVLPNGRVSIGSFALSDGGGGNLTILRSSDMTSGSFTSYAIGSRYINSSSSGSPLYLGSSGGSDVTAGQLSAISLASGTYTQTSTTYGFSAVSINPTYNQSGSTADNTDLQIFRKETNIGSGTQYLIDAKVGGSLNSYATSTKFSVDRTGVGYFAGNLGVGTTSPSAKLSIDQTLGGSVPLFSIASSTNGTGTSTALYVASNGNVGIGTMSTGSFNFNVSGSSYMSSTLDVRGVYSDYLTSRLSASNTQIAARGSTPAINFTDTANGNIIMKLLATGNLGIGTTSPFAKLSVAGDSYIGGNLTATGTLAVTGTGTSTFANGINLASGCFSVNGVCVGGGTGSGITSLLGNPLTKGYFLVGDDSGLSQATSSIFVSSTGRVGIGTTYPGTGINQDVKLHLSGVGSGTSGRTTFVVSNASSDSAAQLQLRNAAGKMVTVQAAGASYTGGEGAGFFTEGSSYPMLFGTDGDVASGGSSYMSFSTGGYSAANERMRIASSGNIGIGTTSPSALLSVNAPAGQTAFSIGSSTKTNFIVNKNGYVGIGLSNPRTALDVSGDIKFDNTRSVTLTRSIPTTLNNEVDIGTFTFSNGGGNLDVTITVPSVSYSLSKRYILPVQYNQSPNGTWVTALPISATSPFSSNDFALDVNVTGTTVALRLRNTSGYTAGTAYITIIQQGVNTDNFVASSATSAVTAPTQFFSSSAMTQIGGNVGIGMITPTYRLDVTGFINTDQYSGYKQNGTTILYASTTNQSTFVGQSAGAAVNATGNYNTALGFEALKTATSSDNNSAIGYRSLFYTTTGNSNTSLGSNTMYSNTTGSYNTALGYGALYNNISGGRNTANGVSALYSNTTGGYNSANGMYALYNNTSGSYNVADGHSALYNSTSGSANVAIGYNTLMYNSSATNTTAVGYEAGYGTMGGSNENNSLFGYQTGYSLLTGSSNLMLGYQTGYGLTSGSNNILLGYQTGDALVSGSNNILIGNNIDATSTDSVNFLNIGNTIYGDLGTGYVGIGKTNPTTKLDVNGDINIASTNNYRIGTLAVLGLSSPSIGFGNVLGAGGAYNLNFYTGSGLNAMKIDSVGNVGIGTTSPYAKLSVAGVVVADSFNATNTAATSTFAGGLKAGGTNGLTVLQNGYVGIGTTSPAYMLTIKGTNTSNSTNGLVLLDSNNDVRFSVRNNGTTLFGKYASAQASPAQALFLEYSNTQGWPMFIGNWNSSGVWGIGAASGGTDNTMRIGVTNAVAATWSANQSAIKLAVGDSIFGSSVGIGTTSPFAKLSVAGDSYIGGNLTATGTLAVTGTGTSTFANGIDLASGCFSVNGVCVGGGTGSGITSLLGNPLTKGYFLVGDDSGLSQATSSIFVSSTGNVGIGTTGPGYKLDVSGDIRTNSNLRIGYSNLLYFGGTSAGIQGKGAGDGSDYMNFAVGGGTRMFIKNNGSIGIGTTSPSATLQLAASGASSGPTLSFTNTNGYTTNRIFTFINNYDGTSNFLNIVNENTNRGATTTLMTFRPTGNIGIGTTSPYARLSVAGDVVASSFIATSTTASSTFAGPILKNNIPIESFGAFRPYSGNPIITSDSAGKLSAWVSVWKEGSTWHMYYTHDETTLHEIYHATSLDGKSWTKDTANNPVLTVSAGKFDATGVWLPTVWKEGSVWYMIYNGRNGSPTGIGLATSSDGINWTKANSGNAVMVGDAGTWDENDVEAGAIIKVGSVYYMWYGNVNNGGSSRATGFATSTDLINWNKNTTNPLFTQGRFCNSIFWYNNKYYLTIPHYTYNADYVEFEMYSSDSPEMLDKQYLGVIKRTSISGWDRGDMDVPFVFTDTIQRNSFNATNGDIWIYYSGTDNYAVNGWQTGLLISQHTNSAWATDYGALESPGFMNFGFFSASSTYATSSIMAGLNIGTSSVTQNFPSKLVIDISGNRRGIYIQQQADGANTAIRVAASSSVSSGIHLTQAGSGYGLYTEATNANAVPLHVEGVTSQVNNLVEIDTGATRQLTVSGAGLVGVASSTPWAQLSVSTTSATAPAFAVGSSIATDFIVANNGNVGVGLTNPANPFVTQVAPNTNVSFEYMASSTGIVGLTNRGAGIQFSRPSDGVERIAGIFNYNLYGLAMSARGDVAFLSGGSNNYTTAPERMRILATNGYVGIGTSSPYAMLSVAGVTVADSFNATNTAATSTFSGGFIAGGTNGLSVLQNGRTSIASSTPFANFAINPVAGVAANQFVVGSSTATSFIITNARKVGIGTTSPSYLLGVGNSSVSGKVAQFENSTGSCYINPTTTSLDCASDLRLKKNITSLASTSGIAAITKLRPVTYNWNSEDNSSATHTGFIAQEVEEVYSDLASKSSDGYYTMNYAGLTPYLVKAVQELNEKGNIISDRLSTTTSNIDATIAALDLTKLTLASTTVDLLKLKDSFSQFATETRTNITDFGNQLASLTASTTELSLNLSSTTALALDIASTTSYLNSQSFIEKVAEAVKTLIQSTGEWVVSKVSATLATFNRIETQTASVSQGLEMKDQATGLIYCVSINNGNWDKKQGTCQEVATAATTPNPTVIPTVETTPIVTPAQTSTSATTTTATSTVSTSASSTPVTTPTSTSTPETTSTSITENTATSTPETVTTSTTETTAPETTTTSTAGTSGTETTPTTETASTAPTTATETSSSETVSSTPDTASEPAS